MSGKIAQPVDAAGGVLYHEQDDGVRILLIFRRGVWDLPKGKKEEEEGFGECAVREVTEETGAAGFLSGPFLIDTFHEYEQEDVLFVKRTRWYAMKMDSKRAGQQKLVPQKEEGIEKVEWVPLEQAVERVAFENLGKVIAAFRDKILSKKES